MSRTITNRLLFVLSLIGAGISGYLTLAHARYLTLGCFKGLPGCDAVAAHASSRGFGVPWLSSIPTAAFGLAMYVVLAGLSFARAARGEDSMVRALSAWQWRILALALLVNIYLIYLEAYVIRAWCIWCLCSSATVAAMFVVSSMEQFTPGTTAATERMDA